MEPSQPRVSTTEGGHGGGIGNGSDVNTDQVMVCVELTSGNLQRNVTLMAMTTTSPTSTGKYGQAAM